MCQLNASQMPGYYLLAQAILRKTCANEQWRFYIFGYT